MLATREITTPAASRIHPRLWQGNKYSLHQRIATQFQLIVLCAAEVQPARDEFPSHVKIIRCPLHDVEEPLSELDANRVMHTAQRAARSVLHDRRTLITCRGGFNRSGLVMATTLHLLTGRPGVECVQVVRRRREGALFNRSFVSSLYELY